MSLVLTVRLIMSLVLAPLLRMLLKMLQLLWMNIAARELHQKADALQEDAVARRARAAAAATLLAGLESTGCWTRMEGW